MSSSCDEPAGGSPSWELSEWPGHKLWTAYGAPLGARLAREFWEKFWDVVSEQTSPWEYVCAEIWIDSGRVIAYPALHGVTDRIDEVTCQVIIKDVVDEWDGLPDPGEDEALFEQKANALERRVVDVFSAAVKSRAKPITFVSADGDLLLEQPAVEGSDHR